VALLLAGSVLERTRQWRSLDGARSRPRSGPAVVFGCVAGGMCLIAIAFLIYRARSLFIDVNDTLTLAAIIAVAAAGLLVVVLSLTSAWRAAPALLALAGGITFAVLPYGILAMPRDSAVWRMAQMVKAANRNAEVVGTYRVFVRNLIFYTGMKQADVINDDHLIAFAAEHPGALVVLSLDDLERLERERGLRFDRLGELPYLDEGRIKVGTLLNPNPAQDLKTVVLTRIVAAGQGL